MPDLDPLAVPERIAFIGDLHANTPWSEKAVDHAASLGAEVAIQLGDFGYRFDRAFLDRLDHALAAADLPLLFVDGNHERHPWLNAQRIGSNGLRQFRPHIWHMPRGFRWRWGGLRWLALGGAHSVDRLFREPGLSWWKEEAITYEQVLAAKAGGPADVLISHDAPSGVVIPGIDDRDPPAWIPPLELIRANEHRQQLRRVVDFVQPRAIFHGHYHANYEARPDFGYGEVWTVGLDCDEATLDGNVRIVDLGHPGRSS